KLRLMDGRVKPAMTRGSFRNLAKRLADRQHRMTDQAGILDRGLAVLDRFAVDRIADHLGKRRDAWVFGDEAVVPALLCRPDEHQLETPLPDDPATQPLEHRTSFHR